MTTQSGVEAKSQAWQDNIGKWQLNRLLENSDITLCKNWKQHLFYPERWSADPLAQQRHQDFIDGAALFPALKKTLDGSLGVVFRKPTKIELSAGLEYLNENTDGNSKGLEQFIQDVVSENLLQGYGGILTDFAASDDALSKADDVLMNRFATMHIYNAESIINVYTIKVGAVTVVQQIVLEEDYQDRVGQFSIETKKQYRVLYLDENGQYIQQIYRLEDDNADINSGLYEQYEPRNSKGERLDYIPFAFFGAESNTWYPTGSPLYDLARMNAKHLEYSAMRNESIRQLAPTMFAFPGENFDYEEFETNNPKGITMGGYNAYLLGAGGSVDLLQASANDAAVAEMQHIESLMVQAGALLITPQSSNVSTETTIIQRSTETSVLGMVVRNSEEAITLSLQWVADYMGVTGESTIDINREFFSVPLSAQDRAQWAQEVMMGLVTVDEFRGALVKSGNLPDSALEEEIFLDATPEQDDEPEDEDLDGNE